MKIRLTLEDFIEKVQELELYNERFSREGIKALFEYYEQYEEETGEEIYIDELTTMTWRLIDCFNEIPKLEYIKYYYNEKINENNKYIIKILNNGNILYIPHKKDKDAIYHKKHNIQLLADINDHANSNIKGLSKVTSEILYKHYITIKENMVKFCAKNNININMISNLGLKYLSQYTINKHINIEYTYILLKHKYIEITFNEYQKLNNIEKNIIKIYSIENKKYVLLKMNINLFIQLFNYYSSNIKDFSQEGIKELYYYYTHHYDEIKEIATNIKEIDKEDYTNNLKKLRWFDTKDKKTKYLVEIKNT
uniref:hypothetical protein n=1 Tax=Brachyspira catarrhinii TaxID=2528966 RepID=UPI003F4C4150